jgi:tRNA (guanine37-N1)-methyltransferase
MIIDILSLFPECFRGPFDYSMIKRARDKGILEINHTDIRDFAEGKHKRVDERPFGGGPGMVMMPGPVCSAIRHVKKDDSHVILLSPRGTVLNAKHCQRLALFPHLILVCGHYEGIDQRAIEKEVDEEISIGDYVLTDGCLPACVLVNGVVRYLKGVLGHPDSAESDSFQNGLLEHPQYTAPVDFEGLTVPEVLRNGNHAHIEKWRREQAIKVTRSIRPDLLNNLM